MFSEVLQGTPHPPLGSFRVGLTTASFSQKVRHIPRQGSLDVWLVISRYFGDNPQAPRDGQTCQGLPKGERLVHNACAERVEADVDGAGSQSR